MSRTPAEGGRAWSALGGPGRCRGGSGWRGLFSLSALLSAYLVMGAAGCAQQSGWIVADGKRRIPAHLLRGGPDRVTLFEHRSVRMENDGSFHEVYHSATRILTKRGALLPYVWVRDTGVCG